MLHYTDTTEEQVMITQTPDRLSGTTWSLTFSVCSLILSMWSTTLADK